MTVSRLNSLASWNVRTRPEPGAPVGGQAGHVLALVADLPGGHGKGPGEHGEQRGLARAVGADEAGQRPAPDGEGDPGHRPQPAELTDHVHGLQHHLAVRRRPLPGAGGAADAKRRPRGTVATGGRTSADGTATSGGGAAGPGTACAAPLPLAPTAGCGGYRADGQAERLSPDHPLALGQDALRPRPRGRSR